MGFVWSVSASGQQASTMAPLAAERVASSDTLLVEGDSSILATDTLRKKNALDAPAS